MKLRQILLASCLIFTPVTAFAESITMVPPPAMDQTATAKTETIVLAGGCFWGVQGVYPVSYTHL
ncbi:hypothetical protein K4H00_25265, partial [Mycobacterium tuberculosis]|nr:hypothetical protein [Mycobacterium tuberculosis]